MYHLVGNVDNGGGCTREGEGVYEKSLHLYWICYEPKAALKYIESTSI